MNGENNRRRTPPPHKKENSVEAYDMHLTSAETARNIETKFRDKK